MRNTAPRERPLLGKVQADKSPAERMGGGLSPAPRGFDETDIPATQSTTQTHARLSDPHGDPRRPPSSETPTRQGTQAPDGQHPAQATVLTAPPDQRLPKSRRICRRPEFLRLQRVGQRRVGPNFIVITERRPHGVSRIGITASRHVGGLWCATVSSAWCASFSAGTISCWCRRGTSW